MPATVRAEARTMTDDRDGVRPNRRRRDGARPNCRRRDGARPNCRRRDGARPNCRRRNGVRLNRRRYLGLSTLAGTAATIGVGSSRIASVDRAAAATDADHERRDVTIESHDGTELAATVYRPADATADDPAPMILHSHGWSGSRTDGEGSFAAELERGFGVLSFDQRGHGDSGGEAHVMNPELEGRDVIAVLDYVTELEWVRRTADEDGDPDPDDPMVFAVGGSYGGGYQLVGAFTETARTGSTRFDALAPEITWYDLSESLAPQGVARSVWALLLYVLGEPNVADHVHVGFLWSIVTGQWPDGSVDAVPNLDERFHRNGPSGFVEDGVKLDVPALFGQGITDNLFNLNQGWHNLERGLTDEARGRSALVGYNGGHALPNVLPPGTPADIELGTHEGACADGGFDGLALQFFESVRDGEGDASELVGSTYALTTADGERCLRLDALDDRHTVGGGAELEVEVGSVASGGDAGFPAILDLVERAETVDDLESALEGAAGADLLKEIDDHEGPLRRGLDEVGEVTRLEDVLEVVDGGVGDALGFDSGDLDGPVLTPTGAGLPTHLELVEGPLTVAGVPTLSATVTSYGVEQRLFAALSVGRSRADATVVANNMLPLREPDPVRGVEREIELPGVAVDVADDERLFLTLSAVSDVSLLHGSIRTPGVMRLEDVTVDVPFLESAPESD
jgi:ABC-2 type transport system ATP-binding protein